MRNWLLIGVGGSLLLSMNVTAGHQLCGNRMVPDRVRVCPDGSIPVFVADETKPYVSRSLVQPQRPLPIRNDPQKAQAQDLAYFFGVWRTRIPGAVWTSPSGYRGQEWLHVSAGVSVGDLIIRPDGTYVWNSYGGKMGRWVRGDAGYPIVLIDTVENRRWRVGFDPKHTGGRDIMVWDGNAYYYDGRR